MPFKKPPTKAEIRRQLHAEMRSYLNKGGKVDHVPPGVSGRTDTFPLPKVLFDSPRETRTYLTQVVASIDARRHPASAKSHTAKPNKPRLKTIYDDFGEPIRKIWVEE